MGQVYNDTIGTFPCVTLVQAYWGEASMRARAVPEGRQATKGSAFALAK